MGMIVAGGCGTSKGNTDSDGPDGGSGSNDNGTDAQVPSTPEQFDISLVSNGATGPQRVNFAIPLSAGRLSDEAAIRILSGDVELPAARRGLARYADGSLRSVQVQLDIEAGSQPQTITIELGSPGATGISLVPVETTLTGTGNNVEPRIWAVFPAGVLAASMVAGPVIPRAMIAGTALDAWGGVCDYDRWDTDTFLSNASSTRDVWLFDRVTSMYRGYAITGELSPLRSAYREASIYRAGMTIANGTTTGLPVPQDGSSDLKYHYSQGVALHYLLTGDDRFREAAEAVSAKVVTMWNPQYDGADRFWTERHAGFALLAHEWAALVTDDQSAVISARADTAVTAFLAAQQADRFGQTDPEARCFAHTATAHGEDWGSNGCSPWMSAILADGLDAHARRVGGTRAVDVRAALARLGRLIARDGRDASGKPLYWMGVGGSPDEIDGFDEHWGESAYLLALAWNATGHTEPALKEAADAMVVGLRDHGEAGQTRSFNWQCRTAVMAPALLQ
ncbi:MAG: hypothetical protein H6Q90_5229 [Deltaproteobacteria bacterium]|nr:hypothetical protein [Deltaproteobacteria bacterium]